VITDKFNVDDVHLENWKDEEEMVEILHHFDGRAHATVDGKLLYQFSKLY
jgi:hypothetical protein